MNLPTLPRWLPLAGCVLLGLLIGWWLWHPRAAVIEPHAAAIELPSGGHVIERVPDAPIPEAMPQAVKELGHGAKLERVISLTVKPKQVATALPPSATNQLSSATSQLLHATDCAPVHIDLGLVSMPDQTHRVIATSDGQILQSVDIPVGPTILPRSAKWAMGALYDPINKRYGGFIDRDLGPFRLGVDVVRNNADPGYRSYSIIGRVGIRF